VVTAAKARSRQDLAQDAGKEAEWVAGDAMSFDNYRPGSWSQVPQLYPWFLLSALPGVLVTPAQLAVAEKLRWSRDRRFLGWLRVVLWCDLAFALLAIAVDLAKFPFITRDWHVPPPVGTLGLG